MCAPLNVGAARCSVMRISTSANRGATIEILTLDRAQSSKEVRLESERTPPGFLRHPVLRPRNGVPYLHDRSILGKRLEFEKDCEHDALGIRRRERVN